MFGINYRRSLLICLLLVVGNLFFFEIIILKMIKYSF